MTHRVLVGPSGFEHKVRPAVADAAALALGHEVQLRPRSYDSREAIARHSQLSPASAYRCDRHRYVLDVDLQRCITSLRGEFLLFALTPPRLSTSPEKAQEIADVTFERLEP